MWFYESGCLPLGPDLSLLFGVEKKRLLSSLGLSGPADQTSRPSVLPICKGKLTEMKYTNLNYIAGLLVVKHSDSTKILPRVAFKLWSIVMTALY